MKIDTAQNEILRLVRSGAVETVPLQEAVGRISAAPHKCCRPIPHFNYAGMDGYAIANPVVGTELGGELNLKITAELAAGDTVIPRITTGEAVRIMTGAAVPEGADRVVPFEICQEAANRVKIPSSLPSKAFIRRRGSEMKTGRVILRTGERISLCHLAALVANGFAELSVFVQPEVRFFCTGSELVGIDSTPRAGQKIDSNIYLLSHLIHQAGGRPVNLGRVVDSLPDIKRMLVDCQEGAAKKGGQQIIISTGGMGPGKYDLVAKAFTEAGGEIIYNSLAIRPGQSTLLGCLPNLLYFALPGPPPAIATLFPLLITPAILRQQGVRQAKPDRGRAILAEDIKIRKPGLMRLKEARLSHRGSERRVRLAHDLEPSDSLLVIPARRRFLKSGEKVTVYLVSAP